METTIIQEKYDFFVNLGLGPREAVDATAFVLLSGSHYIAMRLGMEYNKLPKGEVRNG